jgi:hypothetical protein
MRWGHANLAFEVRGAQAYQRPPTLEFEMKNVTDDWAAPEPIIAPHRS